MRDSWENRFEWIQSVLQWISLVAGVGLSVLEYGATSGVITASVAVTAYTIAMQAIPQRQKDTPLVGGLLALLGVVTSLLAVSLTGGIESPFLLYLTVPVFFASAFHGGVLGGFTTLATIAGLVAVAAAQGSDPLSGDLILMVVFYVLVSVTFTQVRRIFVDEPRSLPGSGRYDRLETAHRLLEDLSSLAGSAELNPILIGRSALRDLAATVPYAAASIAIRDGSDEITVASRDNPGPAGDPVEYPIILNEDRLGTLMLRPVGVDDLARYDEDIDRAMLGVSLAFHNVLLLQSIAHRAVREERVRVARELHDDIGPSLVSIGLGLDLTIHQGDLEPETREHLTSLRETVSELVDEVRATVTKLRAQQTGSLLEHAQSLVSDAPADGPSIVIDLVEHSLPKEESLQQLGAIMTEAVRNAQEHADARTIRIEGIVERESGEIRIRDDGVGAADAADKQNRYGMVGMKERASSIGARLSVVSAQNRGTSVTVAWGPR
ncbi:MAG: histidine kinase [Acidimicrobiia bacterium]